MDTPSNEEATAVRFDPAFAADYLNALLEEGEQGDLVLALRQMANAFDVPGLYG